VSIVVFAYRINPAVESLVDIVASCLSKRQHCWGVSKPSGKRLSNRRFHPIVEEALCQLTSRFSLPTGLWSI